MSERRDGSPIRRIARLPVSFMMIIGAAIVSVGMNVFDEAGATVNHESTDRITRGLSG